MDAPDRYHLALTDWLACAHAGSGQPGPTAAQGAGSELADRIVSSATAGHVLDFDDTYLPGLAHLSAPTAPVAVLLGAERGATVGEVLEAYAAGFEAMAALSAASHPDLYHGGWHPTAVCGTVGAAVTASALLGSDAATTTHACNIAVLGAGGFRAAFGSLGKSLQVGLAASTGLQAAKLAAAGIGVPDSTRTGRWGFAEVFGARWADPDSSAPAIVDNWLKRYPCCLQTHGAIEAAVTAVQQGAAGAGRGTVTVHPISRKAAPLDAEVDTGLQAKFSIPYCTALAILRGHPGMADFDVVDPLVRSLAGRIEVRTDDDLLESEARLRWTNPDGEDIETVCTAAVGSPGRPLDDVQLRGKLTDLGSEHIPELLSDPDGDAAGLAKLLA